MPMPKRNMVRMNINLNADVAEKLDSICEELGCPRSAYIGMALKYKFQSEEMMSKFPEMMSQMAELVTVATFPFTINELIL